MIRKLGIVLVVFFTIAGICLAQGDPASVSAGVIERAATPKDSNPPVYRLPQIETQSADIPDDNGTKVTVKNFVFDGNASISSDDLSGIVESYANRPITFADLKSICRKIQQFYQLKGYFLVRAVLPPQDISQGMLRIQIIEGSIGKIIIRGNQRISMQFINDRLKVDPSKPCVRYNHLLKALILLNEYPSFDLKTTLVKGEAAGTTDLVVDVTEHHRAKVRTSVYNGGPRYVSEIVMGQQFELYDAFKNGDAVNAHSVLGTPAKNLRMGGISYTAPINTHDTKASVSYDYSDFHARRAISDLGIRGVTQTFGLGISQPVIRTLATKLDVSAGFNAKDIKNFTLDNPSAHDRLRVVNIGFDHNHRDGFNGRTFWHNTFSAGLPHFLGSNDANDADMSRLGSGGRFFKWSGEVSRVQNLPASAFILLRGDYQLASETLPASEEFFIGGMDSVRGYPQAEFLGDNGYTVNVELRLPPYGLKDLEVPWAHKPLKDFMQFALFFDHGEAYRKSFLPGEFKDRALTGAGWGLRFFLTDHANVDLDWAYPVGGDDTSDGSDSSFYVKFNAEY